MLSKTLTCKLHLSERESIDHLCINPILWIGLILKWSIDSKSLITVNKRWHQCHSWLAGQYMYICLILAAMLSAFIFQFFQLPEHFFAYLVLVKKFGRFKFLCYYMNNFLRNFLHFWKVIAKLASFLQSQSGHFKFLCYYMNNFLFWKVIAKLASFFNLILVHLMLLPWCKF